jgi:hypothetical protein
MKLKEAIKLCKKNGYSFMYGDEETVFSRKPMEFVEGPNQWQPYDKEVEDFFTLEVTVDWGGIPFEKRGMKV